MPKDVAVIQIAKLTALSPSPEIQSPLPLDIATMEKDKPLDLDAPEELASRSLLLGILYRTIGEYKTSRLFIEDSLSKRAELSTSWIPSTAMFELATLDLVEAESVANPTSSTRPDPPTPNLSTVNNAMPSLEPSVKEIWKKALNSSTAKLDQVTGLAANVPAMASRIESRISMLRDEIGYKKVDLGL